MSPGGVRTPAFGGTVSGMRRRPCPDHWYAVGDRLSKRHSVALKMRRKHEKVSVRIEQC